MRTKNVPSTKTVIAIFVSDMHLRENQPECRTDDFIEAQTMKLNWLSELQEKHDCPVLVAGDLFDKWKPSPWLLGYALRNLPDGILAIPGQHDLPAHNLEHIDKSGVEVLASAGKITLLEPARKLFARTDNFTVKGFPWGIELENTKRTSELKIALVHKLIYLPKQLPFPEADKVGSSVRGMAKELSGFDIIVTGDNHQTIFEKVGETTVVNCGSFMRTTAAQIDHKPSVFLLCEDKEVKQVFVPCGKNVVSREHLEKAADKEDRITAFAERLSERIELGLSFTDNVRNYIAKNKIAKSITSIVWRCVNEKSS